MRTAASFRLSSCCSVSLVLLLGCQHEPRTDGFAASATDGVGDGTTTTDDEDADDSSGGDSETGALLDLGNPELPSDACVAVTQTASVEERPVDLLMVGDPQTDQVLLQAAVTNLLPQLESKGIFDVRVVLIAGQAPPKGSQRGDEFDCGEWDCRGASQYDYYRHIEVDIDPDAVLTEVMSLADQWQQHMRTDTWKHLWISSSRGGDPSMSHEAFTEVFNALGPSYERFTAHTLVTHPGADGDFAELSAGSGGVHHQADGDGDVYQPFVEGVMERLKGTPLSCEYEIPEPPQGQIFDPTKVNVEYADDGEVVALGYVESQQDCAEVGAGWYYDDPAAPTTIRVCPFTCGVFNTIQSGSIEIVFGCATIPAG